MRFGVCCGPGSFVKAIRPEEQTLEALPGILETAHAAGADYVEFPVGSVMPDADESEFEKIKAIVRKSPLKVEAFNSFIPAKYPIVGPKANFATLLKFSKTALRRCAELGGEIVVLGSAGARKIPPGFDSRQAEQQMIEFCHAIAPLAEENKITIAFEPLNNLDDNFCYTVEHGMQLVDEIKRPSVQLLADMFHMVTTKEDFSIIEKIGARLRHTHVADFRNMPPGFASEGESDFRGFFRALRKNGYAKRCSFEGTFTDMQNQMKPMLDLLKKRWAEAAA